MSENPAGPHRRVINAGENLRITERYVDVVGRSPVEPSYRATNGVLACEWCGAVVPAAMHEVHAAWHESFNKTTEQARSADMMNRPLG